MVRRKTMSQRNKEETPKKRKKTEHESLPKRTTRSTTLNEPNVVEPTVSTTTTIQTSSEIPTTEKPLQTPKHTSRSKIPTTNKPPQTPRTTTRSSRLFEPNVAAPTVPDPITIQTSSEIPTTDKTRQIPKPKTRSTPQIPKPKTRSTPQPKPKTRSTPQIPKSKTRSTRVVEETVADTSTNKPAAEENTSSEPQTCLNTNSPSKLTRSSVLAEKMANLPLNVDPATTLSDIMQKKKFLGPRTLHWETLDSLKVREQFDEWFTPVWKRLFNIRRPVYQPLVFEFFSTYLFNKSTDNVESTSMHFSLCGKKFNLTFSQFAIKMNLYDCKEVKGVDFISGLSGWPSDTSPNEFWTTFGEGEYQKNMSCTHIKKPVYRILHRAVSESINQRGSSTNLVTLDDLFYMYCIVNKRPCNLAKCLAKYLYRSHGKTENSAVCGGAYITELALGLGVVKEGELERMTQLASSTYFDEAQLKKLEIVEKEPPLRFVDARNTKGKNASLASRNSEVEGQLRWNSNALYFLIQKLGYSYEPPPHLVSAERGAAGQRANGEANADVSSSNPPA